MKMARLTGECQAVTEDADHDDPGLHQPVLLNEVIELLAPGPGMVFADGTVGSAGHYSAVADRMRPAGILIGLDRDETALRRAKARMKGVDLDGLQIHLIHASFTELRRVVGALGLESVDRVLLDLGTSSDQLANPERGFSFMHDGPLDMRQDRRQALTAAEVVNSYAPERLLAILREYGEERHAQRIVQAIVARRKLNPIEGTLELAELIASAVPGPRGRIHPATRTFQALRIEVGGEVDQLQEVLPQAAELLSLEGRLGVITFHGLEERIVKTALRPYGRHGGRTDWQVVKLGDVVRPSLEEQQRNPRSRSAKLRVYRKVKLG
jgi:16S rRNA (cytosine1402-N4)-methyltransferase